MRVQLPFGFIWKHYIKMTDKQKPTGAETWQDKMPKVPRYYSPTELLERRVSRLEQDIKELRKKIQE